MCLPREVTPLRLDGWPPRLPRCDRFQRRGDTEEQAILAALEHAPHCSDEDVDALMQAIEDSKQPIRFEGPFDDLMDP